MGHVEKVDLSSLRVPIEVQLWDLAGAEVTFYQLRDDEVLEEGAERTRALGVKGIGVAQQMTEKPGVVEVELRGLDEALPQIGMIGLKLEHDV